MKAALAAQQLFLIGFLFTLPYQQDRWKTLPWLPGRDWARVVSIGRRPVVTRHTTRPYKDRPPQPARSERRRQRESQGEQTGAQKLLMECLKNRRRKVTWVQARGETSFFGGKLGKPPKHTHFGLSHHQEERQTQTAFPPKGLSRALPPHC